MDTLLQLMSPAVPHITAELWMLRHGANEHIHANSWPVADEEKLVVDTVTMVVQVNGKVRSKLDVPAGISAADAESLARSAPGLESYLASEPIRTIVREPKLVNFVVK